ncbi:Menaquinone reductase, molybdopterin-binding-like subunit [Fundidesulfovibrio magnetotacticus]|uniref:Menaquinone reductase, molybdopterin-binding-like subunit n=1 Tax=Fundidesulfovibrio magnetotacticus TaxID=2730080 RepID=A0A6V8LRB9_9BACT|nr:molybdopterin-dependent oxidoreductase [Fundidesulfovibrio magnetotacticus]GFK95033.1 Menaquinone reductase, molybdopterin-binding-like subunit [Fundidesulfovibrio magnetotacticus]
MGFGRRRFVGLAAGFAAATAAGTALSPAPWRLARDAYTRAQDRPDLPQPPREPLEEAFTTSLACPSGQGLRVLLASGRPVRCLGREDHPLSFGAATPLAQSEPRELHRPDRVRSPLLKKDGAFVPISWAAAMDLLVERLRAAGGDILAVGPPRPGTLAALLDVFLERLGAASAPRMPSEGLQAARAARIMGLDARPGYDLDNARDVVAAGSDLFGSLPASPHLRRAWAGRAGRGICLAPVRPDWACLCERWAPMAAGSGAFLALGAARDLASMGRIKGDWPDLAEFLALVQARFGPVEVERATGVPAEVQREVALRVAAGALFAPGAPEGAGPGLAPFVAGYALMALAQGVNRPGGLFLTRPLSPLASGGDLPAVLRALAMGRASAPGVLLLVEADPLSALPRPELTARALARAAFRTAFTPVMTASARLCDLILPAPMPLERHGDVETPHGLAFATYGLALPLVRPQADARHPGDVLAHLARRLGVPLEHGSFPEALESRVADLEASGGYVASGTPPWRVLAGEPLPAPQAGLQEALVRGGLWCDPRPVPARGMSLGARFLARALAPEPIDLGLPLRLAVSGSGFPGPEPWRPEADGARWPEVRVSGATAAASRVKAGQTALLRGREGEARVRVALDETVMDGHVAARARDVLAAAAFASGPEGSVPAWDGTPLALEKA